MTDKDKLTAAIADYQAAKKAFDTLPRDSAYIVRSGAAAFKRNVAANVVADCFDDLDMYKRKNLPVTDERYTDDPILGESYTDFWL